MKKLISTLGMILCLSIFVTGCNMGPETVKSEPITDQSQMDTLYNVAKEAMLTYFDTNIEDGKERTIEAYANYVLVDMPSATYLHRNNMIQGKLEEQPEPGELYSYGVSMDPETNAITGAIVVNYLEDEPQAYSVEALQEIATAFLIDKQIIDNPQNLIFSGVEKKMSNKQYTALRFQYNNEDEILTTISLQTGKVTHFEYSAKINLEETIQQ